MTFAHASTLPHAAFTVLRSWATWQSKPPRDYAPTLTLERNRSMIRRITPRRCTRGRRCPRRPETLKPNVRLNRGRPAKGTRNSAVARSATLAKILSFWPLPRSFLQRIKKILIPGHSAYFFLTDGRCDCRLNRVAGCDRQTEKRPELAPVTALEAVQRTRGSQAGVGVHAVQMGQSSSGNPRAIGRYFGAGPRGGYCTRLAKNVFRVIQ
jgi:hypothetical protein